MKKIYFLDNKTRRWYTYRNKNNNRDRPVVDLGP